MRRSETARRIRTMALIDTFVQWLRLRASGAIKAVDAGSIQICPSRLGHGVFCTVPNFLCCYHSGRSAMESCSRTAIRGISGAEDATSPTFGLVAAARAGSNATFDELRNRYSHRLSIRIGKTHKPRDRFAAFRPVLLNMSDGSRRSCALLKARPVLARN
jgi:hypothetical protein